MIRSLPKHATESALKTKCADSFRFLFKLNSCVHQNLFTTTQKIDVASQLLEQTNGQSN